VPVRRAFGSCRQSGHCGRNLSHKAVVPPIQLGAFSQYQLIEDVRQLAEIIEKTHSDAYIRRVGRIALSRRSSTTWKASPQNGWPGTSSSLISVEGVPPAEPVQRWERLRAEKRNLPFPLNRAILVALLAEATPGPMELPGQSAA
jgi:hypothetical protein